MDGTLQQNVRRFDRLHYDKAVARVYDYVDVLIPVLARMYGRRIKGYEASATSWTLLTRIGPATWSQNCSYGVSNGTTSFNNSQHVDCNSLRSQDVFFQ
jgi:hypothetical protein